MKRFGLEEGNVGPGESFTCANKMEAGGGRERKRETDQGIQ